MLHGALWYVMVYIDGLTYLYTGYIGMDLLTYLYWRYMGDWLYMD